MPHPWYSFLAPRLRRREDTVQEIPDYYQMRMLRPDDEGWPWDPVYVDILTAEPFYFDCDTDHIETFCNEYLAQTLDVMMPPQSEVDLCLSDNVDRCTQILAGDLPHESGWIQVQSCGSLGDCSPWSKALTVEEPGVTLMLTCVIVFLVGLGIAQKVKS